jgi:hypothetical protein
VVCSLSVFHVLRLRSYAKNARCVNDHLVAIWAIIETDWFTLILGQDGRLEILGLINATDSSTRGQLLAPAMEKMLEVGATVSAKTS